MAGNELILFESQDKSISLNVPLRNDSVWLNRNQMAELFDRDVKTIGKHVNNAIREELDGIPVVAKFATTASDGKTYQVEHYNIEMITSVGYRVKSKRGTQFRIWANRILKEYLIKGYAINDKIKLEHYNELKDVVRLLAHTIHSQEQLSGEQSKELFSVINDYVYALDTLDNYDYQQIEIKNTTKEDPLVVLVISPLRMQRRSRSFIFKTSFRLYILP